MVTEQDEDAVDAGQTPSKSQRKREALAVKEVGERLVGLSRELLNRLPLDEPLLLAIAEARRIRRGGARKRQIQYIAKLLRTRDLSAIEEGLNLIDGQSQESAQQFHKLERWREGLLSNESEILDELYEQHIHLDRQHLNHLVRRAQKERDAEGETVVHYRRLFRFLRDLEESA